MSGYNAHEVAEEAADKGEDVLSTVVVQAMGYASACWDNLQGAGVFRSDEAREAADSLVEWLEAHAVQPNLGYATTGDLIAELHARAQVSDVIGEQWPRYRTVDS